ncbi:hypothetical protein M2451_001957 [Dysgonomonas sp. PFB1-18]|uniref:hypothetical protein n=1 Tax=unclassified Dysgonomonas TaxID=2630389 RepID=UPI002474E340|nr:MULTISPECIES: hypothetical protein [unclassified Dysgonomonas]MDL2302882.1 hypothetical protein [Dysgonomonas sp. OttesenSCG-928-D17]MDH6309591.1 hypothetical protein [Dysgonomonas sp. PF1-14]MDH6339081.1 hypothetical protein [Dysgonomonas sp. PF1-16]MDH6380633.1 hypothetical protein [Dysgonomonas sp. PFB1-18]MDH6398129.1 hypothetical protein [Dysgonomonas sp. PF1-23]
MTEIIAILMQKGALSKGIQNNTTVNIFELEDDRVKGVETLKLENTETNYFSLLMALKKVTLIYVDSISNDLKNVLNKIGINIKNKDELTNDRFISQFIFD